jgi:hypothetical protein
MVRGRALKEELLPLLRNNLDHVDAHIRGRIVSMIERYKLEK